MSARVTRSGAAAAAAATAGAAAAGAAAPDASVAPLLELQRASAQAASLKRPAEAAALLEQLLAAATASQPADSLIVAVMLRASVAARLAAAAPASASLRPTALAARADAVARLWRGDAELLRSSRRCLALCHARWQAGALWTLTPAERAFFAEDAQAELLGGEAFAACARDALRFWPPAPPADAAAASDAEGGDAVRLRGVHGALRALLERDAAGRLERCARTGRALAQLAPSFCLAVRALLSTLALTSAAAAAGCAASAAALQQLRGTCGLSRADEAALRRLDKRLSLAAEKEARAAPVSAGGVGTASFGGTVFDIRCLSRERAARGTATDVAQFVLRRCALPGCNAREARPRAHMLCSRCRGAAYCCAAHGTQDFRRHKRVDGCAASD
jgi:hypothetical protein